MKIKRFIAVVLTLVMVFSALPMMALALDTPQPSSWAVSEINDANTAGLLTPSAAMDFQARLTRAEFAELVVIMVEKTLGRPLPVPAVNPFTDTSDINILKAFYYGIVTGTTPTTFRPDNLVERQQICAMMIRAIKRLETDLNRTLLLPPAASIAFNDAQSIESYAVDPVRYAVSNGIFQGDQNNNFNPRANISSQECVVVVLRSFNRMERAIAQGQSQQNLLDMAYRRVNIGFAYGDTATGVTRNLTLPTTSTGPMVTSADGSLVMTPSTVTWQSSNPAVISAAGVVHVGTAPQDVTLTATINIGGTTRAKTFQLRTSTLSGNALLLQNAYDALNIIYLNENDNAGSVTGRIGLPTRVLGLPVTWLSNNPAVVTNTGIVNVPAGQTTVQAALSATFTVGGQSRTKTFNLTVVNPAFAASHVSLHNVELNMTTAQVAQVLGTPIRTITAGTNENWQLYHTNYNNFIAVALIGGRVVAVYSMAAGAANQLRNNTGATITIAQANAIANVNAVAQMDGAVMYGIMIYDTTSQINSPRTLVADGQEQLLFEFINAFRVRNGSAALVWAPQLGTASRAHSVEMGTYNYLNVVSIITNQTLQQRAEAAGFATGLFLSGNVLGLTGVGDALAFFREMVANQAMRTEMLSGDDQVFGAGFSGGNTGAFNSYITYMYGRATVLATSLAVTYPNFNNTNVALTSSVNSEAFNRTLVMGINDTLQLNATPNVAGATVTWQISAGNVASINTVGNNVTITSAGIPGNVILTATMPTAAGTIAHTFTLQVVSSTVELSPTQITVLAPGQVAAPANRSTATVQPPALGLPPLISWSSVDPNIASPDVATAVSVVINAGTQIGTVGITATQTWNTTTHLGIVRTTANLTVSAIPVA